MWWRLFENEAKYFVERFLKRSLKHLKKFQYTDFRLNDLSNVNFLRSQHDQIVLTTANTENL